VQFGRAFLGAGPPYQCQAVCVEGASGFDWSTVTSAYFSVTYPNGTTAQWAAAVTNQVPPSSGNSFQSQATLTHPYAAGTDLSQLGKTYAVPIGVCPAGNLEAEVIEITVTKYPFGG
jgi:hypothetical protein